MKYKLMSLFDGSGGFPLAGAMCGIVPVAASEVEPYPIAVTRSRFPGMKHLGDISKINGAEIEPVDIITFGSPCQDLSVAGKRAGLKHEANGDDETTRSGLFMEAIRIIKEMRKATNGVYPTVVLWENVPGAFSSNRGEDFRIVLEELIKIVEPGAVMPPVPKAGWAYADSYSGDGWSLAYRVFDAQYWGVPQRRRRIHLVLHLTGQCARNILFEREGVRGYFAEGRTPWQRIAANTQRCSAADDREGKGNGCIVYSFDSLASNSMKSKNPHSVCRRVDVSKTLDTIHPDPSKNQGGIAVVQFVKCYDIGEARLRTPSEYVEQSPTLTARCGTGGNNVPAVCLPVYCLQGNMIGRADKNGPQGDGVNEGVNFTLNTIDRHGVCYALTYQEKTGPLMANSHPGSYCGQDAYQDMFVVGKECPCRMHERPDVAGVDCRNMVEHLEKYPTLQAKPNGGQSLNFSGAVRVVCIVRRLTPTECARLQGFADCWGVPDHKDDFTDEEYRFWCEVIFTKAKIDGTVAYSEELGCFTIRQYVKPDRKKGDDFEPYWRDTGKPYKDKTKDQVLKWYNKLHTDSAEYKMWGNGIALPPAIYCMQGIVEALEELTI